MCCTSQKQPTTSQEHAFWPTSPNPVSCIKDLERLAYRMRICCASAQASCQKCPGTSNLPAATCLHSRRGKVTLHYAAIRRPKRQADLLRKEPTRGSRSSDGLICVPARAAQITSQHSSAGSAFGTRHRSQHELRRNETRHK